MLSLPSSLSPLKSRVYIHLGANSHIHDQIDQNRSYCQISTRKRGPAADAGHHCLVTDLSSVRARQRTPNGMGWPSYKTHHDLITQNRFFCQVLIIKETRGRRWPPLPPSICQSLTADTRGSASRRHTVDHAPLPQPLRATSIRGD